MNENIHYTEQVDFYMFRTRTYVCKNNENKQATHMKERKERFEGKKRNGEKIYL